MELFGVGKVDEVTLGRPIQVGWLERVGMEKSAPNGGAVHGTTLLRYIGRTRHVPREPVLP